MLSVWCVKKLTQDMKQDEKHNVHVNASTKRPKICINYREPLALATEGRISEHLLPSLSFETLRSQEKIVLLTVCERRADECLCCCHKSFETL